MTLTTMWYHASTKMNYVEFLKNNIFIIYVQNISKMRIVYCIESWMFLNEIQCTVSPGARDVGCKLQHYWYYKDTVYASFIKISYSGCVMVH